MTPVKRIAMWSGPRNISTAMMRAWGQRADTAVIDEPFYACYLKQTGREHPGAEEIVARHETDPDTVIATILGPVPGGRPIYYQKHMPHHMLPGFDRSWFGAMDHAFLIREPADVITSFMKNVPDVTVRDTGLLEQLDVFQAVRAQTGRTPPVIDSRDVLREPARALRLLCEALGVEFEVTMLTWPPGPRETDGVWAKRWYAAVERSTGFSPYAPKNEDVPERLRGVLVECQKAYDELAEYRIAAQ